MADDLYALADLLTINDTSLADITVSDILNKAPFMAALSYVEATHGTIHKYTKETGAPVVGFRDVNGGRDLDSSIDTAVTATLEILDWSFLIDQALADSYVKGGYNALLDREGIRHLRQAMFVFEKQIINGTVDGSADGFAGMADVLDDSDDSMVVNAGGTTADTASSVYAVRIGRDDLVGVLGMDGNFTMKEPVIQQTLVNPGTDNKSYPAYYTAASGFCGLQVGSAYSFGRICNLTEDSGKGLTDDLIADLLSEFPSGGMPTQLVMNRRSLKQLQQSRTATNQTGAPAPFPTEAFGVPILTTDSILNTEALLTAA